MRTAALLLLLCWSAAAALAAIDTYPFDDPQQEARFRALTAELRCPKCQNQNIADSDAPIAADLRRKVYDLIKSGNSEAEVVDYMVQRYGNFVTYRPPVTPLTWPLWFGPLALIILIGLGLAVWIRRAKTPPEPLNAAERERLRQLLGDDPDSASGTESGSR